MLLCNILVLLCNFLIDVSKNGGEDIIVISHGSIISYMKRLLNIKSSHIKKGQIESLNNVDFDIVFKKFKELKGIK